MPVLPSSSNIGSAPLRILYVTTPCAVSDESVSGADTVWTVVPGVSSSSTVTAAAAVMKGQKSDG